MHLTINLEINKSFYDFDNNNSYNNNCNKLIIIAVVVKIIM